MEKLVRDLIPQIIAGSGRKAEIRHASEAERLELLIQKLHEEVAEFVADKNIEELADVLEVIHALASEIGATFAEVEDTRKEKANSRGAFSQGVVLVAIGPTS